MNLDYMGLKTIDSTSASIIKDEWKTKSIGPTRQVSSWKKF